MQQPAGKFVNDQAATFTIVLCAPTKEEAYEVAAESFVWYVQNGVRLIASVAELLEGKDLGTYQYTARRAADRSHGLLDHLTFDYLHTTGSSVVGDPDECVATAKRYEAAGCDLLLCLVNPYKIPHERSCRRSSSWASTSSPSSPEAGSTGRGSPAAAAPARAACRPGCCGPRPRR